jgi:hypothetical protein
VVEPVDPPTQVPVAAPIVIPVAPSFRNPLALRVGLFAASIATFLFLALPYGFAIWLPSAGFISVFLFSRRTGQHLTVRGGAHMGWIVGILSFAIIAVISTISAVTVANQPGGLPAFFREHLNSSAMPGQDVQSVLDMLANPLDQALFYLFSLLFCFAVMAVFCTAGGALGAKVLDKD